MQVKIEILKKGDSVLNVWDNNIAVQKKNGDVEIFHYSLDENGLPRLSGNTLLITQGDGVIRTHDAESGFEVGTF